MKNRLRLRNHSSMTDFRPRAYLFFIQDLLVQVTKILLTLKKKEGKGIISFGNSVTGGPELGEDWIQGPCDVWPPVSVSECVCHLLHVVVSSSQGYRQSWPHTCHPCDQGQAGRDPLSPVAAKETPEKVSGWPHLDHKPTSVTKAGLLRLAAFNLHG